MNARTLVFSGCLDFVKVVLVELPHKRGKVVVFKVKWQEVFGKFGRIFNNEGVPYRGPSHNVR